MELHQAQQYVHRLVHDGQRRYESPLSYMNKYGLLSHVRCKICVYVVLGPLTFLSVAPPRRTCTFPPAHRGNYFGPRSLPLRTDLRPEHPTERSWCRARMSHGLETTHDGGGENSHETVHGHRLAQSFNAVCSADYKKDVKTIWRDVSTAGLFEGYPLNTVFM